MSGAYTHITMAQKAIEDATFHREGLLHEDAKLALGYFQKFCIVGSLAPDYPYLDIVDSLVNGNSASWADDVHHGGSVEVLRSSVIAIRDITDIQARRKCIAWLFGFASHMATDGTIHPVVNLKVGEYITHKSEHRCCEMHQDVYCHKQLNLGAVDFNQQVSFNVRSTSDPKKNDRFDADVAGLWRNSLLAAYPGKPEPNVHGWHSAMYRMMLIAETGGSMLFPFARHVAANEGLVYPVRAENQFIKGLAVPGGTKMDFDILFNKAKDNVLELWGWLAQSLQGKPSPLDTLESWSLDTGEDNKKRIIYWS
jgi:hypothetical protein